MRSWFAVSQSATSWPVIDDCSVNSDLRARRRGSDGRGFVKRHLIAVISIVTVAVVGAIVAIVIGWTGVGDWRPLCDAFNWCVGPSQASPDDSPPSTSPHPSDTPSYSASATAPNATPTPTSEQPTQRLKQETVTLSDSSSTPIKDSGLRVSTGYVFDGFARVRISTDESRCEELLNVGDSIVMSNRSPGELDYSEWYAVVLTSTDGGQATLEWSIGTGAAPSAAYKKCI